MPHEKIWDADNTGTLPGDDRMPDQNVLEIHWTSAPTGHVQVTVDRPGVDARGAVDETTAMNETLSLLSSLSLDLGQSGGSLSGLLGDAGLIALARLLAPKLAYSYGAPVNRLGIVLDRDGLNRVISTSKRAGRAAFGPNEW